MTLLIALIAVLIAGVTIYRISRNQPAAEIAARDMANWAQWLSPYDNYGTLQLAIRAYRTDANVDLGPTTDPGYRSIDRLLPDYTAAQAVHQPPTPSSTTSGPTGNNITLRQLGDIPALSEKVSADGRILVTEDADGHSVVWRLAGQQLRATSLAGLFHPLDRENNLTVSRSGRYVAFSQTVVPYLDEKSMLYGPVDKNGLPKINPADYRTCVPGSLTSWVNCLVLYDTSSQRRSLVIPISNSLSGSPLALSIDPTDHVLGAVITNSANPFTAAGTENTLLLWDIPSGRQLARIPFPWHSWIGELWLDTGGHSAIIGETLTQGDPPALALDRDALSFVDLALGTASRHVLADHVQSVAMSLDGSTLAARDQTKHVTIWNARSGTVTTQIQDLSTDEQNGAITLNATGSELLISWRPDLLASNITDVNQAKGYGAHISTWALPEGAKSSDQYTFNAQWSAAVLLGDGQDSPVALLNGSTVGLVLAHPGQQPTLHRLSETIYDRYPVSAKDLTSQLCKVMADPNTDGAVRKYIPPGAYQGTLCP